MSWKALGGWLSDEELETNLLAIIIGVIGGNFRRGIVQADQLLLTVFPA